MVDVLNAAKKRDLEQVEFLEALKEVIGLLKSLLDKEPTYLFSTSEKSFREQ